MTPHVKGCRCEACQEGRTEQHPQGCLCQGCADRESAYAPPIFGLRGRVRKALDAASSVKDAAKKVADVLTPAEREAALRFLRGLR